MGTNLYYETQIVNFNWFRRMDKNTLYGVVQVVKCKKFYLRANIKIYLSINL